MPLHDITTAKSGSDQRVRLQLFIAKSTPNSNRAQHNLTVAIERLKDRTSEIEIEVIDVFAQPKSALKAGVIVTPTLIGSSFGKRICLMGDLSDPDNLHNVLVDLLA